MRLMLSLTSRRIAQKNVVRGQALEEMVRDVQSPYTSKRQQGKKSPRTNTDGSPQRSETSPSAMSTVVIKKKRELNKVPLRPLDYLTTMRNMREEYSKPSDPNEADFIQIKNRAKLRGSERKKPVFFLGHLVNRGMIVDLSQSPSKNSGAPNKEAAQESKYHSKQRQMMKARSVNMQDKSKVETEKMETQRKLQRDADKAEQAQKDINLFGFQLYEYLISMKECSYVSEGKRTNRFGVEITYIFYSNRRCQQVHDLAK